MTRRVVPLPETELCKGIIDAKLVAFRWDLIRLSLVLDLDVSTSEKESAPDYRAWVVCSDIRDITMPLDHVRLADGCWLTSEACIEPADPGFMRFRVAALLPVFDEHDHHIDRPGIDELVIHARRFDGFRSIDAETPGEFGLTREQRLALADDEEMLQTAVEALRAS